MAAYNSFPDYQSKLDETGHYGKSYMDFNKLINWFNISRLPDYDNATEPLIPHIIMTRPDLNLTDTNVSALRQHTMTSAFLNDGYGYSLFQSLSNKATSMYLPIVTTRAMSYSVGDVAIKTIDKGGTFYGHIIKYGKHSEDHKISNSITIDFRNDRFLSVLKMIYIWMTYIYLVSKTDVVVPDDLYQKNGVLDYCGSIYYLVTRRDDSELVYWEKLVGVFPTSAPFSIFSSSDNYIVEDHIGIEFVYGIKSDPCDPSVLMDLNILSGYDSSSVKEYSLSGAPDRAYNMTEFNTRASSDVYAKVPFVMMRKDSSGGLKYMLQWIKP